MTNGVCLSLRIAAAMCLLVFAAARLPAQTDLELTAKKRLYPAVGPGLRAVKRGPDGHTYVLASPSPGLLAFDEKDKQLFAITSSPTAVPVAAAATGQAKSASILFGEDCDVDSEGRVYVADRGANAIEVLNPEGSLLRSIPVHAPVSLAALGEGEVAVATLHEQHLVVVFDKNGRDVREFGDPEQMSERADLNRFLNIGELAADARGHLYYGFLYTPEPTVRQYDRYGYDQGQDFQYTALEAASEAQAVRREILRQEKHGKAPVFKRVLTAVGIDRERNEVWMAVGNTLLRFDKDGSRRASYKLYTPEGARLEASVIVLDPDRLLIGSDPLGVYEFERPDKKKEH